MPPKKPLWTNKNFEKTKRGFIQSAQERADNTNTYNSIPGNSGLLHTEVQEPVVNFNATPNQLSINSQNAAIVLGTDRPGGLASGYGARGAQGANTIDIVVGRMASARQGQGSSDGAVVDPQFGADAARIYISQKTDIDKNFGIANGNIGSIKGQSAIGIKADGIRLIAREGIKIVTGGSPAFRGFGPHGETNSLGGRLPIAPPIELIAGNITGDINSPGGALGLDETIKILQPISKGNNTRDALRELGDIVEEILGTLFSMALIQTTLNSALGVTPIYPHSVAAGIAATQYMVKIINPLWQTRINKIIWQVNHLEPYGYKYICSKNVYAT